MRIKTQQMKSDLDHFLKELAADPGRDPEATPGPATVESPKRPPVTLTGVERFRPFFDRLRAMLGLDDGGVSAALGLLEQPSDWTGVPGLSFKPFAPGPGGVATEAVLVRVAVGATFPRHTHLGREVGCVLEGVLLLDGRVYHPGDIVVSEAGTAHELTAGPAGDLVLVVAHSGISFG
jgi:putative transcriptional regulator